MKILTMLVQSLLSIKDSALFEDESQATTYTRLRMLFHLAAQLLILWWSPIFRRDRTSA